MDLHTLRVCLSMSKVPRFKVEHNNIEQYRLVLWIELIPCNILVMRTSPSFPKYFSPCDHFFQWTRFHSVSKARTSHKYPVTKYRGWNRLSKWIHWLRTIETKPFMLPIPICYRGKTMTMWNNRTSLGLTEVARWMAIFCSRWAGQLKLEAKFSPSMAQARSYIRPLVRQVRAEMSFSHWQPHTLGKEENLYGIRPQQISSTTAASEWCTTPTAWPHRNKMPCKPA